MTPRLSALLGLAIAPLLGGCARQSMPPAVPGTEATAPLAVARAAHGSPVAAHRTGKRGEKSRSIPDGAACIAELEQRDITFHELAARPGMTTPVAVTGAIGGIRYETVGNAPLVCDCRLVVALDAIAPELQAFGVESIHHSGAYVFRTTKRGGPSLHAKGLAIDVHQLRVGDRKLEVLHDFVRGAGPSCKTDSPILNRLVCELDRSGLFQQVITPDDDSDHRDHVHLAIAPL